MKKVAKAPLVIEVLNIPAVQRSLERLADLLGKIQKALGEYLERERASFPRYNCFCYICTSVCARSLSTFIWDKILSKIYFAEHLR